MRTMHRILVLVLLGIVSPGLAQAQNKFALLIGIDVYTSSSLIKKELKFAAADARSMEESLTRRGWKAKPLLNAEASRRRIIRELHLLSLKAGPSDKVLIYFAGHGVRDGRGKGTTYWITTDASVENLVADGIRLNHILEYVNEIGAQEKILILDHCYSGDFESLPGDAGDGARDAEDMADVKINERDLYPEEIERLQNQTQPRLVIIAAARGPAYEDPNWGHGMFTKAMLDALNDPGSDDDPVDEKISLRELWDYLNDAMADMASQRNLEQRPLSNASINQLEWQLFDAPVEDVSEEAKELWYLLTNIELAANSSLEIEVKKSCIQAINAWEQSTKGGLEPDSISLEIVRILRLIKDQGVGEESMKNLVDKVNQLRRGGGGT